MNEKHHRPRRGADTIRLHKLATCRKTGKLRLRDAHQARDALSRAKRQAAYDLVHAGDTNRRERRFYRCSHCNGFHLTSEARRAGDITTVLKREHTTRGERLAAAERAAAIRRIAAATATGSRTV